MGGELRTRANQRFVYSGRSILITNIDGGVAGQEIEGFYVEDTRLLSRDEVTADGVPLTPIVAAPAGSDGFLAYAAVPESATVPTRSVYVEVARAVGDGLRTELRVENYHSRDVARFDLAIHLVADFADINETTTGRRQQTAEVARAGTWSGESWCSDIAIRNSTARWRSASNEHRRRFASRVGRWSSRSNCSPIGRSSCTWWSSPSSTSSDAARRSASSLDRRVTSPACGSDFATRSRP